MCGGESSRTTFGGTIAILKAFDNLPDISLIFHGTDASTTAMFQSPSPIRDFNDCHIVIHRDGDLRAGNNQSILHSLPLSTCKRQEMGEGFSLAKKLDLGVGDEGIVGRRVSLVRDTLVLRQGIIGWN